ncbi:hypothetical protein BDN71DRAFT_1530062 [Pleurotus eryngii]|uniref:Uncharacterized protein n=1 Tax=Pleurotus eryngii TaxID=5323 RepID=A0A9P5ZK70_PLEER|nr:hypothetical protein BDN71DRAFT_1530062 [Pleurotus eryngii]
MAPTQQLGGSALNQTQFRSGRTFQRIPLLQNIPRSPKDPLDQPTVSTLDALEVAGALPEIPQPLRTLDSAKRQLGIDPDLWITQYAICPCCWKHFSPTALRELETPECQVGNCAGLIYEDITGAKGETRCRPLKIIPQVSLIDSLHRMFLRPGFARSIRDSRGEPECPNDNDDFVMEDIHHGAAWHAQHVNITREVDELGRIRDQSNNRANEPDKLTAKCYGLHLTLNADWLGLLSNRPHSTGLAYMSINDLKCDIRFLQTNVVCAFVMPGTKEPDTQQINHCLEPLVLDLLQLKNGVKMEIYDDETTDKVFADLVCNNCDTPAARKISGTAGHAHEFHPCPYCETMLVHVNQAAGYNSTHQRKGDFPMLRQAFQSCYAQPQRRDTILNDHALDFMHNVFLGLICHLFMKVLFAAHMFPGAGDLINSVQWPSHITCLLKNLSENQSLKKADEWRRILAITPVLLWCIPDTAPPVTANENITTTHSRQRRSLYSAILLLCAGVRLLAIQKITMAQARLGQDFLIEYCHMCLCLRIPLVINHHLSTHFFDMIKQFGPIYAWWLFAFERFNGMLERIHHNGHNGGRMELTLLRNWTWTHLVYELLLSLPPDAHAKEHELLEWIIQKEARSRRSMMSQIAIFRSEVDTDNVKLPRRIAKSTTNIHHMSPTGEYYRLLLRYFQDLWPNLDLVTEFANHPGQAFVAKQVARALPYIRKDGIRYRCASNRRTQANCYAFILKDQARLPVKIEALLVVNIPGCYKPPHVCAIVKRLRADENIPILPWDHMSSTLGIHTSYRNEFWGLEVISAAQIDAPLAMVSVYSSVIERQLSIAISFDHVSQSTA